MNHILVVKSNNKAQPMKQADIVVVGGSAAGLAAAIAARRHHPQKSIPLVRKEEVLIPCEIPYVFGTVETPESSLISDGVPEKNDIELLITEVQALDTEEKVPQTDEQEISYERLILVTVSKPAVPPIPGTDLDGAYRVVKDVEYADDAQARLESCQDVVIIGGGSIGIEFGDEINKMDGKNVTIVEMMPRCLMLACDEELCISMEKVPESRGVGVSAPARPQSITGNGRVEKVLQTDGSAIDAKAVIVGVGAVADADLATDAGLVNGPTGGIQLDRTMKTSADDVFACGDCAENFLLRPQNLRAQASVHRLDGSSHCRRELVRHQARERGHGRRLAHGHGRSRAGHRWPDESDGARHAVRRLTRCD